MENNINKEKLITIVVGVMCVAIIIFALYLLFGKNNNILFKQENKNGQKEKVIEESLYIPSTTKINLIDGIEIGRGSYNTKLVPKTIEDKIIVPTAKLTLKQGFDLAWPEAQKWSPDAKLIFIKSMGVLTLEGRTGQWQVVFGSQTKNKAYEIIIQLDGVVSQKEIITELLGNDLPKNWFDSNDAIISLQNLPQFSEDTVSSINFYYNSGEKKWSYGFATGEGKNTTSMWVE